MVRDNYVGIIPVRLCRYSSRRKLILRRYESSLACSIYNSREVPMRVNSTLKRNTAESKRAVPGWLEPALQGITFWIGHRRLMYRHYHLSEGAIIAELCNLIQAQLPDGRRLDCEEPYKVIIGSEPSSRSTFSQRADLVITSGATRRNYIAVIEVKRADAGNAEIEKDIDRLARVKVARPDTRAFVIVVSEAKRPRRFVNNSGRAFRKHKSGLRYAVRRVCAASASVKRGNTASYAVLVEVL